MKNEWSDLTTTRAKIVYDLVVLVVGGLLSWVVFHEALQVNNLGFQIFFAVAMPLLCIGLGVIPWIKGRNEDA